MFKDIYDISNDLLTKIQQASQAKVNTEIAYSMLLAEIEVNLTLLKGINNKSKGEKWWNCISLLSTDALALVIFNEKNRAQATKDFEKMKVKYGQKEKEISGVDASFFVYRKISALKQIALLSKEFKDIKNSFRVDSRIENIKNHYDSLLHVISLKIRSK
jgi:hypothetical protein